MAEGAAAIGVFDSGVGGLTVLRRLAERLPDEHLLYLGDTARVPYGTKSPDTVVRYARTCTRLLAQQGIKLLVVACNTASAYALDILRDEVDYPVVGVVAPGARAALACTRSQRIGVIGTAGTIQSGAYEEALLSAAPTAKVFCKACPLFVPLAEEGWTTGAVPRQVAAEYLYELLENDIDTLVLGCTHYPLLAPVIAEVAGEAVTLVDSAQATAEVVAEVLDGLGLANTPTPRRELRLMVTDAPATFERLGRRFLGWEPGPVEWVDLNGY